MTSRSSLSRLILMSFSISFYTMASCIEEEEAPKALQTFSHSPQSSGYPFPFQLSQIIDDISRVYSYTQVLTIHEKSYRLHVQRLAPLAPSQFLREPTLCVLHINATPHFLYEHQNLRFFFTLKSL